MASILIKNACLLPIDAAMSVIENGWIHIEGERQKHRHGGGRPESRQDAHDGAEKAPDEAPDEVGGLERDREAVREAVDDVHLRYRAARRGGERPRPRRT